MFTNEQLEKAICEYQTNEDIELLKPYFGQVEKLEPFGEPELAKAINSGDVVAINDMVKKLSTFSMKPMKYEVLDNDGKVIAHADTKEEARKINGACKIRNTKTNLFENFSYKSIKGFDKLDESDKLLVKYFSNTEINFGLKDSILKQLGLKDAGDLSERLVTIIKKLKPINFVKLLKELGNNPKMPKPEYAKNIDMLDYAVLQYGIKNFTEELSQAKVDLEKAKEEKEELEKGDTAKYLDEKIALAEKYAKGEDKKMNISTKDFNALMRAMKKVKNFDDSEDDEVVENEETETIEIPTDVANAIRDALDDSEEEEEEAEDEVENEEEVENTEDEADESEEDEDESEDEETEEEVEDEEEEDDSESDEDEEVEEEEDEEEDENFSLKQFASTATKTIEDLSKRVNSVSKKVNRNKSLASFAETVTETVEKLSNKVDELAKEVNDKSEEKVVEFSRKEFMDFAQSVTETIESIASRVNRIEPVVNKLSITKDLSALKDTGAKANEYEKSADELRNGVNPANAVVDDSAVVNNCGYSKLVNNCGSNCEDKTNFSSRYESIKKFMNL